MSTSRRKKKPAQKRGRNSTASRGRAKPSAKKKRGGSTASRAKPKQKKKKRGGSTASRSKPKQQKKRGGSTATRRRNRAATNCQKSLEYTKIRLSMCTKKLGEMVAELRSLTI